jgi:HK97 family phage prohead protease
MTSTPITFDGKALRTTELRSGELELSGYCVVWEGLDATSENFVRGSIRDAIPTFLNGSAPMCWHHDAKAVIGRVLELQEDSIGVRIRARIDHQPAASPLRWIYDLAKRGGARGLSIAGLFHRAARDSITKVLRLTEVSLTAVPTHAQTLATVADVKAVMSGRIDPAAELAALNAQVRAWRIDNVIGAYRATEARLTSLGMS